MIMQVYLLWSVGTISVSIISCFVVCQDFACTLEFLCEDDTNMFKDALIFNLLAIFPV